MIQIQILLILSYLYQLKTSLMESVNMKSFTIQAYNTACIAVRLRYHLLKFREKNEKNLEVFRQKRRQYLIATCKTF